jgi:cobalamin biosynthesis protein CbiG
MSRLYILTETDINSRVRAHKKASAEVRWGSRSDSKLAARIEVTWDKDQEVPTIKIIHGESIIENILENNMLKDNND